MKKITFVSALTLFMFSCIAISETLDPAYLHPYHDSGWGTHGLWHLDSTFADPQFSWIKYTADDDANDIHRNHDMQLSGSAKPAIAASFSPEFGNCMYFDGTCHLSAAGEDRDPLDIDGQNFKAEAWFKVKDPTRYELDFEYDIVAQYNRWWIGVVDSIWAGNWLLVFNVGGNDAKWHTVVAGFDANSWHHVAASYYVEPDGCGIQKLFLDGVLVNSMKIDPNTDSTTLFGPARRVGIGSTLSGGSPANKFRGWIDEVRISQAVSTSVECGFLGYFDGDLNADCYVNMLDLKLLAANWIGGGADTMEYATQKAADRVWVANDLMGSGKTLQLSTRQNHTPGGQKSIVCDSAYNDSMHVFSQTLDKGAIEFWFYDPYDPLIRGAAISMGVRLTIKGENVDNYFSIGVNPQIEPEDNYFVYASDVGWMNPIMGPYRSQGWHKVRITFGDKDPDTGQGPGGSLYFDDMHIADNNDMRLGINRVEFGDTWYYTNITPFYIDDVQYIGPLNVYIGPSDISADGKVNFMDFARLGKNWMMCTYPLDAACVDAR